MKNNLPPEVEEGVRAGKIPTNKYILIFPLTASKTRTPLKAGSSCMRVYSARTQEVQSTVRAAGTGVRWWIVFSGRSCVVIWQSAMYVLYMRWKYGYESDLYGWETFEMPCATDLCPPGGHSWPGSVQSLIDQPVCCIRVCSKCSIANAKAKPFVNVLCQSL